MIRRAPTLLAAALAALLAAATHPSALRAGGAEGDGAPATAQDDGPAAPAEPLPPEIATEEVPPAPAAPSTRGIAGEGGAGSPPGAAAPAPPESGAPPPPVPAAKDGEPTGGGSRPRPVVRVAAVGDVMMGNTYPEPWLPPDDGARLFDAVRLFFLDRHVVLANLEGTLYDGDGPSKCDLRKQEREVEERRTGRKAPDPGKGLCFSFRTPARYARHLADAGIGAVNVANNHARDFLDAGLSSTLAALDNAGVAPFGGDLVARFTAEGVRVAVLGFSYSPPSRTSLSMLDLPAAAEAVRRARKEADLVVVSFHGGAEGREALHLPGGMESFAGEKRGDPVAFARAVIDAGAHLVVGHGPHVPRALELYRGKLVAYSLGNFLAHGWFSLKGESGAGYVLRADLDGETGDFLRGRIVPVRLVPPGIPRPDPEREAVKVVRRLTREDRGGGGLVIRNDGTVERAPE